MPLLLILWMFVSISAVSARAQGAVAGATPQSAGKAALTGTISDQTGNGVPGATVTADNGTGFAQNATTDGQGLYATELPAGSYTISVTAGGNKVFQANVTLSPSQVLTLGVAGALAAQLPLNPPVPPSSVAASTNTSASAAKAAITGTVSDQTGSPVAGASVVVDDGASFSQTATSDGQGLYVVEVPPGSYNVSVVANGVKLFRARAVLSPSQALTLAVAGALIAQADSASPASQNGVAAAPPTAAATPPPAQAAPPVVASVQQTAPAAGGTGSITGLVTDQTGAALVGATVKVSAASKVVAATVADEKGNYSVVGLPPGSYTITASQPGFKDFVAGDITLGAGIQLPLDASLEPAGETTQINVESQTVGQVETESASVSGTITQKEVTTLGLNGRNFTQLIALTPGVSNQTGQDEAKVGVVGSVKYSVNGGRVEYNTFEVDGSDVLNAGLNGAESTLVVYPSLDAIQEVKVLTSNYGAMFGRTASGTVLVTTKTGGDHWHGDAYEFIRNEVFNARNYFDQTVKAPKYRRNDFGFTIGGPIKKNKTYIFWSQEFRIEDSPSDQHPNFNHGVPSLAERAGDFSDVCPTPGSGPGGTSDFLRSQWPDCPNVVPGSGTNFGYEKEFPNNNIFAGPPIQGGDFGESSVAAALLSTNLIPLPNSSSGCSSSIGSCYDAVISEPTSWREELGRLDHNITSNLRLSLHGIYDSWSTTVPVPQWPWNNVANSFPTVQNRFVGPGTSLVAHLTHTITPTLLNELEGSFINSHITLADVNGPGNANYKRPAGLGTPGGACSPVTTQIGTFPDCPLGAIFNNGFGGKAPGIIVGGTNAEYGGNGFVVDPSYMPFVHTNPTYSVRDNLSKSIGKHTLQAGVQAIFAQRSETNGATGAASGDVQGLLNFSNVDGGAVNTGNAFANLLSLTTYSTGVYNAIRSYTQDSAQSRYYNNYWIEEPYVQDDWKVTSRLTLNLGVRFSLFGLWYEKYHEAYNWTPATFSSAIAAQLKVDPCTGRLLDASSTVSISCTFAGSTPLPQTPIPINVSNPDPRITNGLIRCGTNGVPNGCMTGHLFNPAPRIGFAWDPRGDGKTSIRGGYGIFFEHGTGEEANTGSLEASAPNVLSMTQNFPVNYGCIGGASFTTDPLCASTQPGGPGAFPLNVTAIPTKAVWPYAQQWSLSAQRELPGSMVATVAYVGSKGTHLTVERQLNQLKPILASQNPFGPTEPLIPTVPGTNPGSLIAGDCGGFIAGPPSTFQLSNGTVIPQGDAAYYNLVAACAGENSSHNPTPDVNTLRPYPGFGQIFSLQNVADSSYHALQTTMRRVKGPLTVGGSYTYSHSLDDSSDRSDSTFVNSYDLRSNKASSNFDQRHLLNVSYIYTLPTMSTKVEGWTSGRAGEPTADGQDQPLPSSPSRFLRAIADGWQISGITVFQSGTPFSVINGSSSSVSALDNAGVANGVGAASYPDVNPHPGPRPDDRFNTESFGPLLGNPNMFVAPRGLTFGDAGRNFLNNPHRINFDMSLLKHFPITEGSVLEFRAEAFNVFNHTQFRLYNSDLGNTGSNTISCYGGPNYTAGFQGPTVNGAITGTDCITGNSFLHPVDAHRPRTIQFGLKYTF